MRVGSDQGEEIEEDVLLGGGGREVGFDFNVLERGVILVSLGQLGGSDFCSLGVLLHMDGV